MLFIFTLLVANVHSANCPTAPNGQAAVQFCSLTTACTCGGTAPGSSDGCTNSYPSGLFATTSLNTAAWSNHASAPVCSTTDPFTKKTLFFPGEEITTTTNSFCTIQSRKTFKALTAFADLDLAKTGGVYVATATANKICGLSSSSAVEEIAAADALAHEAEGATGKKCQSLTHEFARKVEACTEATKICDRYLDVSSGTPGVTVNSCILKARKITAGNKAAVDKLRCVAVEPQVAAADVASKECTYDATTATNTQWCNPGRKSDATNTAAAERCVADTERLGAGTTIEGSILAVGVAGASSDKICIGKKYWKKCVSTAGDTQEVCNPYTTTAANICLPKKDVLMGNTAHGKTGTSDATPAKVSWCVPHTLDADFATTTTGLEESCKKTEVCNKASKAKVDTCLLKKELIGGIAAGADWTHLGQLRKPAKKVDATNDQWCFAKVTAPSVLYFAKRCVSAKGADAKNPTNEICNPNAKATGDVCVLAHKTLEHGEMATKDKQIVIGDSFYKLDCAFAKGSETVANWGATAETEVCITKKELLNEAEPLNALRTDAAGKGDAKSPLKICMSKKKTDGTNGFQRCAIDDTATKDKVETQVCNPNGVNGGSDHTEICVTKTRVLGQGEVVTKAMVTAKTNICIGVDASSTCVVDQACDLTTGTCFIAAGKESTVLAAWTEAVDDGKANLCVGKEKTETCTGAGYWCNPLGTTADGKVTLDEAKETSICLFADALHFNGGSICLTYAEDSEKTLADTTSAIKCGEDEPYCDDAGKCSATETVSETTTPATGVEGEVPAVDYAATTSIWIGVAIAATLW